MIVDIKKIIDLRMKLHRMPELSFEEKKTSAEIEKFFKKFSPDNTIKLGETALAFVFDSGKTGDTVVFRAELDALPIAESSETFNKSLIDGVSHKCGHDGHMAILAGLGEIISNERPKKGKVVLLYQPAEETLEGALSVIDNPKFNKLNPNWIFGLHNLPGYPANSIIIKKDNFTVATNGVTIKLLGQQSHSSNPKAAINPTVAVVKLLQFLHKDILNHKFNDFVHSTPIFTKIGTPNFGLTPGKAEIKVTLRANDYSDLDKLIGLVQDEVKKISFKHKLQFELNYTDDAAPIVNHADGVNIVQEAAEENNFKIIKIKKPLKFADDFSYYTIKYKGVYFGFGIGEVADLHNASYEFPDNFILPAIKMYYSIYKKTNL